jgi:hypothetical protein
MARFDSPLYPARLPNGSAVTIDVTNSISAGLDPNRGMLDHLIQWMKQRGYRRILDFGAGALRHAIPLLQAKFEVVAVEYERAYQREKAREHLARARKYDGFTALVWPHDFLKTKLRYDVALLMYVLQVVPTKVDRSVILESIAKRFDRDGPRRLYYASRYGEAGDLPDETRFGDGWIRGRGPNDRSFYTEWNANVTDQLFNRSGYERMGSYEGASQPFIYDYAPGAL